MTSRFTSAGQSVRPGPPASQTATTNGRASPVPAGAAAAAGEDLIAELSRRVQGEVRFDPGSRALYAADLSMYRQVPIGVVIPRTFEDVAATVEACRARGIPILGRGAG